MISYLDLKFLNYSLYYDDPCCMLHILHNVDKVLNLLTYIRENNKAGSSQCFVQDSARKPKDKLCDWFWPSLPLVLLSALERAFSSPVGTYCMYEVITQI